MARYVVRFMKVVLGENGHESEICQRSIEVNAADKLKAADLAKVNAFAPAFLAIDVNVMAWAETAPAVTLGLAAETT